jgi:UDP-glucose 4-epimerase
MERLAESTRFSKNKKNMKNKKILVTGCAGFIPSFVAERLVELGAYVIGLDNLFTGKKENMQTFINKKNFKFIKGDVQDKRLLQSIIKNCDYVYHGAIRGIGISAADPTQELDVNTKSTLQILEIFRKHPIKRFIYPSSASVYGNTKKMPESENDITLPLSPYGVSKLAAEKYCIVYHHMYKIPVVALRYFNTYGPRQRKDSTYGGVVSIFINSALGDKPLKIYGNGKQTRDFTYINDTVDATITAFTAKNVDGEIINIAAGHEYSVNELANKIKIISGKKLKIEHIEKRSVDNIDRRYADISKAKKMLDYKPSTLLDEGLKATYEWNKLLK